jgi:hypothetical protein
MATAHMDPGPHYYCPSWCFAQLIEETIGSRSVSAVGEPPELGRHPWHRNHRWQQEVAEWFHISELDLRLVMESCCFTYVMTMEFHMANSMVEPADFEPCKDLCS